jgi:uncharacterized membrane protein YesL
VSLGGALRASMHDFYFNSWRLAPANLLWGAVLILAVIASPTSPIGLVLLVALAVPTVGIYRMSALIARGEPAGFSDFLQGMRHLGPAAALLGLGAAALAYVFTTNVFVGLGADNPLGWLISALALWGLVGLAMLLVAAWPLLVDPDREDIGIRSRLTLAGLVVIGRPLRVLALTLVVAVVLTVSTVLFALLAMVSVAYIALVSCRYVLPLADELEARLPEARRAR